MLHCTALWADGQPKQLSASITYETARDFTGVDGLAVQRLETSINLPYLIRPTYAGDWAFSFKIKENRLGLTGPIVMGRRFYRFSLPMLYEPRYRGRWSYRWFLEPSMYGDESIISQTRYVLEYGFVAKYKVKRKVSWVAGIKRDNRFGGTTWYPVFGLESRPNSRMVHHWVFPDVYSQVKLNKRLSVKAYMKPNGSQWLYDQGDGSSAIFILSDWNIGAAVKMRTRMPYDLVIDAGMSYMGEGSVAGQAGDLSDGFYIKFGLETPLP